MRNVAGKTTADEPVPVGAPCVEWRQMVHNMLEGPWAGTEQIARMQACVALDHPRIHGDPERECYCRWVKP